VRRRGPLAGALVDAIRERCERGDVDQAMPAAAHVKVPKRTDLAAGDQVAIGSGDFSGMLGQLAGLDDHGWARVLLELLGRRDVRVNFEAATLVPA
jgi:hypothetical protein